MCNKPRDYVYKQQRARVTEIVKAVAEHLE
jgi:hypothetical protein